LKLITLTKYAQYCYLKELETPSHWHSGNDNDCEGVYRQADRELILWQPLWAQFNIIVDPDGGSDENCLYIHLAGDANAGKWADDDCTTSHRYICERE